MLAYAHMHTCVGRGFFSPGPHLLARIPRAANIEFDGSGTAVFYTEADALQ